MTKRIASFQLNELTKSLLVAGWIGCVPVAAATDATSANADAAPTETSATAAAETPATPASDIAAPAAANNAAKKTDDAERVEVVGSFRQGLAVALDDKRNANDAVDSVVAEDIADFPDLNLAESLQRIPGVTITRVAGEGRSISVRGLGPGFTRTRINGMEAQASSGGTDAVGGANRGRGFDYNVFASELFSNLAVHKTASADVEEGALGATVELRTSKPLDYEGNTAVISAQAGYNDRSEATTPKATVLFSTTNDDRSFGALVSFAYSERELKDEGASTVRWSSASPFARYQGNTAAPELAEINAAFYPRIPRYDSYTDTQERTGATLALQWKPNDDSRFDFDVLYSLNDETRREVFLQTNMSGASQISAMNVLDYEVDATNTMTYGAFSGASVWSENRFDELSTEYTQLTLAYENRLSDALKLNALVGHSESNFDNPIQTTTRMRRSGVDFSYDYRAGHDGTQLVWGSAVDSLTGWISDSVRLRPQSADNEYDSMQLSLEWALNDVFSLKGGLDWKEFSFASFERRRAAENGSTVVYDASTIMAYEAGLGSNPTWLIPNQDVIAATYNLYGNSGDFALNDYLPGIFSAVEETTGYFAQLDFTTELGSMPFRGDVGFRGFSTDQSSTAWGTVAGAPQQLTASHSYDDLLPALNMVLEPFEDVLVRFNYADVISRAGLGSITPNVTVSVSGSARTVSGGDPTLEPTRAASYNLGLEYYFAEGEGFVGGALFLLDVDSWVQTLRQTMPFTATGLDLQLAIDACEAGDPNGYGVDCNENVDWNVTFPTEGKGGEVEGFELAFQFPFSFLGDGFFSHFGVTGNYTHVESQFDYVNTTGVVVATRSLVGLSEDAYNFTLFWENETMSARVSYAYRDDYLTNAIGRDGNDLEGTHGTENIDASIAWNLTDNLKLSLEALNLTDEAEDQYVDSVGDRLNYYHQTGSQYYVGATYTF